MCIISNVTTVHASKNGAFFLHRSLSEEQMVIFSQMSLDTEHFSLSWNWETIFFLSNNFKPIFGVGKVKMSEMSI